MVREDDDYASTGASSSSIMSMRSSLNVEDYDDLRRAKADRVEVVEAMGHDRRVVGAALAAVLRRIDALEEKAAWSEEQREDVDGLVDLVHRVIGYIERLDAAIDELRSGSTSPTLTTTTLAPNRESDENGGSVDHHRVHNASTTHHDPIPKHHDASMTTAGACADAGAAADAHNNNTDDDGVHPSKSAASRISFARSRACVRASRLLHASSKLTSSIVIRPYAYLA